MSNKPTSKGCSLLAEEIQALADRIESLEREAATDPIRVAEEFRASVETTRLASREALTIHLGLAYAAAASLRESEARWADFIAQPFWSNRRKRPRLEHRPAAARWLLRFGMSRSRARAYSPLLEWLAERGVGPTEARAFISAAGGPTKARKIAQRKEPLSGTFLPGAHAGFVLKPSTGSNSSKAALKGGSLGKQEGRLKVAQRREASSTEGGPRRADPKQGRLEVHLDRNRLRRAMSMQVGDIANAVVERHRPKGGGPDRFVLTLLQRLAPRPMRQSVRRRRP